jgi:preprotein translocase subunit YajC
LFSVPFAFLLMFQSAGSGFSSTTLLLPVFLIAMVLMSVIPNRNKQKKWQAMLAALKPGDVVTTVGGLRGTILNLRDETLTLRVAPDNIKLEFLKSAIASVTTTEEEK